MEPSWHAELMCTAAERDTAAAAQAAMGRQKAAIHFPHLYTRAHPFQEVTKLQHTHHDSDISAGHPP